MSSQITMALRCAFCAGRSEWIDMIPLYLIRKKAFI